jgi:hypothetical protein
MESKEFFSLFPEFRFEEKIEKPLELILHSNVISTNALNTIIANAIEKSKLGEASFVKHDIFSSPAFEGFRSIINQKNSYGCERESQDLI